MHHLEISYNMSYRCVSDNMDYDSIPRFSAWHTVKYNFVTLQHSMKINISSTAILFYVIISLYFTILVGLRHSVLSQNILLHDTHTRLSRAYSIFTLIRIVQTCEYLLTFLFKSSNFFESGFFLNSTKECKTLCHARPPRDFLYAGWCLQFGRSQFLQQAPSYLRGASKNRKETNRTLTDDTDRILQTEHYKPNIDRWYRNSSRCVFF